MDEERRGRWSSAITLDNHGPYVTVAAVLMMIIMILSFIVRVFIRVTINGPFKSDDVTVAIGSLFGLAQTIVTLTAVGSGLGKRSDSISFETLNRLEKLIYSADVLYVVTLCLSKMSAALLIARLTRTNQHLKAAYATTILSLIWGVVAFLIVTVRCANSQPWRVMGSACTDRMSTRWIAVGVLGNLVEFILTSLPLALLWDLQMPLKPKAIVLFAFSFRLPVILLGAFRLEFLDRALNSRDYTFSVVVATVFTQIEMQYSLIASTIPCMRPFLNAFNTGFMGAAAQGTELSGYTRSRSRSRKQDEVSASNNDSSDVRGTPALVPEPTPNSSLALRKDATNAITQMVPDGDRPQHDSRSITTDGSDRMIIRKSTGQNESA